MNIQITYNILCLEELFCNDDILYYTREYHQFRILHSLRYLFLNVYNLQADDIVSPSGNGI